MSLYTLSFFGRSQPALRKAKPCFRGRLCFPPELSAALRRMARMTSSCSAPVVQSQEKSEESKNPLPNIKKTESTPTVTKSGILHALKEATYYHGIMENLPNYQSTIFTRSGLQSLLCENPTDVDQIIERQDWSAVPNDELVNAFRILTSHAFTNHLTTSMPQFDNICSAIASNFVLFLFLLSNRFQVV